MKVIQEKLSDKRFMYKNIGLFLALSFFLFSSCKEATSPYKTQTALGTLCTIQLFDYGRESLYKELFARLDEIENHFSPTIASSEIAHINAASGDFPLIVSEDVFYLLEESLSFAKISEGFFDPTIGSLVKLWNISDFSPEKESLPTNEEIQKALSLVNYENLDLSSETRSVYLREKGMSLDLGGIAKGWAADEVVRILKKHKVPNAIVNLGGNIYAYGKKENTKAWSVGIKNPFDSQGDPIIKLEVENTSVVTSGLYERFFEVDGIRYHHILDVHTGYPIDNELVSVTIIDDSSMKADAYSTTLFAFGLEKSLSFANKEGIDAILITKDKKVFASDSIKDAVQILDADFVLYK